ncbi:MAG TPA: RNA polymerase sigma factor [Solirubrobacteraceae bacterium]|nr:RNA polymerase sigma factor [Solirubrobacteraceae bacterium]
MQSDERLVALARRGQHAAFEALVGRYQARLLAFCRHMLSSREDAEDVLQEVFAAAFNAMLGDDREINVRPWLYRIARNRSLNHLRRQTAVGQDSMDVHLADGGTTTAERVHRREEFRQLVADVQELPETQRTALLLREIDALSYEQIAEAMDATVPSIKSLLVRARVSLAEAAEARQMTCEEVREELGEVAEGLRRSSAPGRRHVRQCERCDNFRKQLRTTNRQLAVLLPVAPLLFVKKAMLAHAGTTASASGATAASGAVAGSAAAGGAASLGGALATVASKTVAGLAAAAIVTAGAVEVKQVQAGPERDRPQSAEVRAAGALPPGPMVVSQAPGVRALPDKFSAGALPAGSEARRDEGRSGASRNAGAKRTVAPATETELAPVPAASAAATTETETGQPSTVVTQTEATGSNSAPPPALAPKPAAPPSPPTPVRTVPAGPPQEEAQTTTLPPRREREDRGAPAPVSAPAVEFTNGPYGAGADPAPE